MTELCSPGISEMKMRDGDRGLMAHYQECLYLCLEVLVTMASYPMAQTLAAS